MITLSFWVDPRHGRLCFNQNLTEVEAVHNQRTSGGVNGKLSHHVGGIKIFNPFVTIQKIDNNCCSRLKMLIRFE